MEHLSETRDTPMLGKPVLVVDPDRARACLLGGAIGDQLGYPEEFSTGPFDKQPPAVLPPYFSDDTQMTLFMAEGLVLSGTELGGQADALLRWYKTQAQLRSIPVREYGDLIDLEALHAGRAPGNTCMSACGALLRHRMSQGDELSPLARNDSAGCGAVMRAAPYGIACASRRMAVQLACRAGQLTHGHVRGWLPAGFLAGAVWGLVRGEDLGTALRCAEVLCAEEAGESDHPLLRVISTAIELGMSGDLKRLPKLGEGWVGDEALAFGVAGVCALYSSREHPDPEQTARVLWALAAHKGDSDSTAAIGGNLIGAMLGQRGLPPKWIARVELREVVEGLADQLVEFTHLASRPS
jgi:ADP-ribosylglycohydrolase